MLDISTRLQAALEERFRIARPIGMGGMATVFLAEDLRHQRPVAVKVVRPEFSEALGAERFLREIRVTASLVHPNILPLLDSGEADGLLYYVMPFVEGATLDRKLRDQGQLGIEDALTHARDLADALDYAHRAGLVHRDVKPSNIFLEDGHALIGDFGVALVTESQDLRRITSTESVIGTAEYMSPEQCTRSHRVDARSDIYSLGCLLYEMLAGEPPFLGRSRMAVVARQIGETPPPVSMLRGDVPPDVDRILQTCLSKSPADRYASAGELRDALDAAIDRVRTGSSSPVAAPKRRPVALVGAATVLVITALMVVFWPEPAPALNAARVVVFPLADRGGGITEGADVAMMIGNALVHTQPLSWIDGWERLTPEQRSNPALLSPQEARSIALDRGARHFVTGGILLVADSLNVRLVLHDAEGDSIVGQATASGHVAEVSPDQLGLRAVMQLLPPLLDPGRAVDVSYLERRDPAGIALWIQGDREYREARFARALDLYHRALEADSLLAYAALKGAQAATWIHQLELAEELLRLAIRHDSILPERHAAFAQGLQAFHSGEADLAVERYRHAVEADPQWAEVWAALGNVYWHLLPRDLAGPDSAVTFFRRAVELDPDFVTPLAHLAEHALRQGDLEEARRLTDRLEASRREPLGSLEWLDLMRRCAEAQPGLDGYPPEGVGTVPLLNASKVYAAGGARFDCAEAGFRWVLNRAELTRGERWVALLGLQSILVAQGRGAELSPLLAEALELESSTNFLFALDVIAGAGTTEQARSVAATAAASWGPDYATTGPVTAWLLGLWSAHEGNLGTLDRLVIRLETLRRERADAHTATLADAVQGHQALARGDTARAIEIFSALRSTSSRRDLYDGTSEPLAPERILLAELLLATGDAEEAFRVARIFDHPEPLIFVPFIARSLAIRLEAAQALSGAEWERRAREVEDRLIALGRQDLLRGSRGGSP